MAHQVVIAGGGIIGASTAYYLSQKGVQPLVIEACTPACSSSGKAGGFLALNWCDGSAVGPLARKSYHLHAELAESLGIDCGYRTVRTHSVAVRPGRAPKNKRINPALPDWVDRTNLVQTTVIGTQDDTAQVHPERLTKALLHHVEQRGGAVRERTKVVGVTTLSSTGAVCGVRVVNLDTQQEETIPASAVVFALGAWSSALRSILPRQTASEVPEVSGLKVHSIVVDDSNGKATADALFLAYDKPGVSVEPEVYPRPDNTVYVCGVSSDEPPPPLADDIKPDKAAIALLRDVASSVSEEIGSGAVLKEQACFLPCTDDGIPTIGEMAGLKGAYIATGHSCWGILNGPATGLALAELIVDGTSSSVDLSAFSPARFAIAPYARR